MTLSSYRRALTAVALCLAVAGCQSEGSEWNKRFDDNALKPPSSAVEERFGKGPVEITLLVPRGSTGVYDDATRDVRDGAALAAAELGDAFVNVRVVDTSGGPQSAREAAEAAVARNSGLLLSYNVPDVTSALASIAAADRPPIINLSQAVSGEEVFNFATDEIHAAVKAAQGASPSAKKSIVVVAPVSFSAEQERSLAASIQQTGGLAQTFIRLEDAGSKAGSLTAAQADLVKGARAVLLLGSTAAVSDVLTSVKKINPDAQILGTENWSRAAFANPASTGAIIASSEPEGSALVADRYLRHKGRALTSNAALAYDSVAIGSGFVRAGGPEALTASALKSPTGFRGVSGVFRFGASGSIERQLGLYRVEAGKLVPLEAANASF
ncbi:MAG: hypothetical protein ACK4N1_11800 [Pseudorhizobium sp.]